MSSACREIIRKHDLGIIWVLVYPREHHPQRGQKREVIEMLRIFVLASGLAVATQANAIGTVSINGVVHHVIYMTGTASVDHMKDEIVSNLIDSPTYYQVHRDGLVHTRAYAGTAKNIPGHTGTRILYISRSFGGSFFGAHSVAQASRSEVIDVNNCNGGLGTRSSPFICATVGIDRYSPNHTLSSNAGRVPDFSLTDVEPIQFQGPYNSVDDQPGITMSEMRRMQPKPAYKEIMGFVSTRNLPETTKLTRLMYGAIMRNQIQSWSTVSPELTGDVVLCRRTEGSGTQTAFNAYFTGFPCTAVLNGGSAPGRVSDSFGWKSSGSGTDEDPYVIDTTAGYTVLEMPSASGVSDCLEAAYDGRDLKYKAWDPEDQRTNYFVANFGAGGPRVAIGVLSLGEYRASAKWAFRNMDGSGYFDPPSQQSSLGATGIAPSKENVISGNYDFFFEATIQGRTATVSNAHGDVVPPISGVQMAFMNEFRKVVGSPKYTGNFEAPGNLNPHPFAYVSDSEFWASLTNSTGALFDVDGMSFSDKYVGKFGRGGNSCNIPDFVGNVAY